MNFNAVLGENLKTIFLPRL